jgi:hypothetical protein
VIVLPLAIVLAGERLRKRATGSLRGRRLGR